MSSNEASEISRIPTSASDNEDTMSVSSTVTTTSNTTTKSTGAKLRFTSNVIPWESGTNRCASQKGMGAFGSPRRMVMDVASPRPPLNRQASDTVIPKLTGGADSFPRGDKFQPFGDMRDVVRKMDQQKPREKKLHSRNSDTFLSLWASPNPNATNTDIGKPRGTKTETVAPGKRDADRFLSLWASPNQNASNAGIGKLRGTKTEAIGSGKRDRRCDAVLPRLLDMSALPSAGANFQMPRQVTMKVEGLNLSLDDEAKSKAVLPWATGRLAVQTQSGTGGFLKPRDVCNQTYYDEKKPLSSYRFF